MGLNVSAEEVFLHLKQNKKLENLIQDYLNLDMRPIFGYELEFYLPDDNYQEVEKKLNVQLQKEKGKYQYEINQGPFFEVKNLLESIDFFKNKLNSLGANLTPKPLLDDYGSSMHLHFNIITPQNLNMFENKRLLKFAANGICYFINSTIYALLNTTDDYLRLDAKFMAPTHICYGNNNRTVAVRVPDQKPTRIEYRICSSLSNPYIAIFVMLKSSLFGIQNKYDSYPQIFGNAFDQQYMLKPIVKNLNDAIKNFTPNFFFEK
jgi:glutamine synthetase